jgi:hypothetical protein
MYEHSFYFLGGPGSTSHKLSVVLSTLAVCIRNTWIMLESRVHYRLQRLPHQLQFISVSEVLSAQYSVATPAAR